MLVQVLAALSMLVLVQVLAALWVLVLVLARAPEEATAPLAEEEQHQLCLLAPSWWWETTQVSVFQQIEAALLLQVMPQLAVQASLGHSSDLLWSCFLRLCLLAPVAPAWLQEATRLSVLQQIETALLLQAMPRPALALVSPPEKHSPGQWSCFSPLCLLVPEDHS